MDMSEWEILSHLHPGNNIQVDELDMLGHHDFETNHYQDKTHVPLHLQGSDISFIDVNRSSNQIPTPPCSTFNSPNCLSPTQHITFDLVMSHYRQHTNTNPLKLVIQGTEGTEKSYLIGCLQYALHSTSRNTYSPLLLLAPTGVTTFNINTLTIHFGLRIPITTLQPLEGQALANLQECIHSIHYILIDEMSFIKTKILTSIDALLREAFAFRRTCPFGDFSIILIGDLGQLPPTKYIPMYVGVSHGNTLWCSSNAFVTLSTVFCQQGDNPAQVAF